MRLKVIIDKDGDIDTKNECKIKYELDLIKIDR